MQSFEVPPLQVLQVGEHGLHVAPSLKLPSGQRVPVEVTAGTGSHRVLSFAFWVKFALQAMHAPVPSAH